MSCQTAHQLRRLADPEIRPDIASVESQVHSGIFDWLICPPRSVIGLLNNDIPDFNRENIRIHKERPYWEDYNLFFWHNFTVTRNQNRQLNIDETIDKEIKRWSHLRTRFSELDPQKTIFVVSNTQNNLATEVYDESEYDQLKFTIDIIEELEHSLARYFGTSLDSIQLEVVTRKNRSSGLQDRNLTSFFPVDQNEWKGSKESWNFWWEKLAQRIASCPAD